MLTTSIILGLGIGFFAVYRITTANGPYGSSPAEPQPEDLQPFADRRLTLDSGHERKPLPGIEITAA